MRHTILTLNKKDFRRDTFRCGGNGGQNVNKVETGVRYTHIESGISGECREHRTQGQNDKVAFQRCAERVVQWFLSQIEDNTPERNNSVIRTYNETSNRIKDHDTGQTYSWRETFGKGDISKIIEDRHDKTSNV